MGKLYMIPDRGRIGESLALSEKYDAGFEYNDFFDPDVLDDVDEVRKRISFYKEQRRDRSKDTLHGAFLDVTVHSQDRLIREASMLRVRQSMEIAEKLGLRGVVFHTGRIADFRVSYYLDNWLKVNAEFWKNILTEYPGQEIFMENMFDEAPDILGQLAETMKEEKRFGVCLDYAHAALTREPGEKWFETLSPYIRHMHINDNDLFNDLHLAVGDGKIDWKVFGEFLTKYNVNASVLIEVNDLEKQRKSIEYIKNHGIL